MEELETNVSQISPVLAFGGGNKQYCQDHFQISTNIAERKVCQNDVLVEIV